MPRLIWVFAGRTVILLLLFFSRGGSYMKKQTCGCLCLCCGLTSQSTIFQSCRDGAIASWVINQYFRGVKCLAQGHNTAAVGFEPPTSRSGVRHSTTEPPRSPTCGCEDKWCVPVKIRNMSVLQYERAARTEIVLFIACPEIMGHFLFSRTSATEIYPNMTGHNSTLTLA